MRPLTGGLGILLVGLLALGALLAWLPPYHDGESVGVIAPAALDGCQLVIFEADDEPISIIGPDRLQQSLGEVPQILLNTPWGELSFRLQQVSAVTSATADDPPIIHVRAMTGGDALPQFLRNRTINVSARISPDVAQGSLAATVEAVQIGRLRVPASWLISVLAAARLSPGIAQIANVDPASGRVLVDFADLPMGALQLKSVERSADRWQVEICPLVGN